MDKIKPVNYNEKICFKCLKERDNLQQGTDTQAIKQGIKALDAATQEFAARRMDKSIRRALSGQSVDSL